MKRGQMSYPFGPDMYRCSQTVLVFGSTHPGIGSKSRRGNSARAEMGRHEQSGTLVAEIQAIRYIFHPVKRCPELHCGSDRLLSVRHRAPILLLAMRRTKEAMRSKKAPDQMVCDHPHPQHLGCSLAKEALQLCL